MASEQGSLDLLNHPVAQSLLSSAIPLRLSYVWLDGTPRVVPIWFHWNGQQLVLAGPPNQPKVKALQKNPAVAGSIDGETPPYPVLLLRGTATVDIVEGVPIEYQKAAERYYGEEQGKAWVGQVAGLFKQTARIAITPTWVGVLDFVQRFPNQVENAIAGLSSGG